MGRPRLSEKRTRQFGVRLTDAEAIAVEAAAARRGVPPVLFIRSAALVAATGAGGTTTPDAVDRVSPDAAEIARRAELAEAIDRVSAAEIARRAELRRIGVNLNQVVHHLHQGRNDREDLAALRSLVEEVRDQVTLEAVRDHVALEVD